MIGLKIIIHYIILLYWSTLLAHSQECLDPETIRPEHFVGVLYPGKNWKMFANRKTSYLPLPKIYVYELSHTPIVQYIVLRAGGHLMTFQLKERYCKASAFIKLRHNSSITVGISPKINTSDTSLLREFLKTHGTSKDQAFQEMKAHCNLLVLQEKVKNEHRNIEQTVYYLRLIITSMLCYCVYFLFNCAMNYRTLRKIWRKEDQRTFTFVLYSLSQSLTNNCLSKYYLVKSENIYEDLYERITQLGQTVEKLKEQLILSAELRKVSICTYDYVESNRRPPQVPLRDNHYGYISPSSIHDYITVVGDNFSNVDKTINDLKLFVQTYAYDAQHQDVQRQQDVQHEDDRTEYKTLRNIRIFSMQEDLEDPSLDMRTSSV